MQKETARVKTGSRAFNLGRMLCRGVALLLAGVLPALAQNVPIQVACKVTILDQLGRPLSREDGDLVQILFVNNQIYPPGMDGQPHTNNPVSYISRIGNGLINHTSLVGRFNASITPRSEAQIFARVFNAPTLEEASFYADSQIFTPDAGKVFYPEIGATTNALDPADDDGDGLSNSMEKDLGSNPNSLDSDGDGMSDMDEFRSGTGLADEESYLAMVELHRQDAVSMMVQWSAVPGKSYQLQAATEELTSTNLMFWNVNAVVNATGDVAYTFITNSLPEQIKSLRVLLVE